MSLRTVYGTLVRESLDLSEVRVARQPRCLYGLSYQTLPLSGQETGYIRRVMELAQDLPVIMPVWTEPTKIIEAANAGETSVAVDDLKPTLFSVLYDFAIIWESYQQWEIVSVGTPSSGGSSVMRLIDPISKTYPVGTLIFPILIGKLARSGAHNITDEHGVSSPDFSETWHGLTDQSKIEIRAEYQCKQRLMAQGDAGPICLLTAGGLTLMAQTGTRVLFVADGSVLRTTDGLNVKAKRI